MSEKGLFLQFTLETNHKETKPGQDVYIIGEIDELGDWKTKNAIKLNCIKFPKWESETITFYKNYDKIEYKYIIVTENNFDEVKWEEFSDGKNREINLYNKTEGYYFVKDGEFNNKSTQKILNLDEKMNEENEDYKINDNNNINNKKIDNIGEDQKELGNSTEEIKIQDTNKIGLQNIGSTCYMNATLQCFIHISKFISFFLKLDSNNLSDDSLSISFKNLIEHLWNKDCSPKKLDNNYYIPTDFRKKIANKSPLFQNDEANDAKDLVNFIIMTLHEELNKVNNNIINSNFNFQNGMIDQTNQKLVFQTFINEFKKNNQSIISDLFYAMNLSVTQCNICKKKLYNYQIYYFLVFPLEEVRKFKYQKNMNNFQFFNNMNMPNEVSIYDCFDYEQKINYMIGQNKMYCNYCKTNNDCMMNTTLVTGPDVLILLLNRGKGIQFNVKINFVEYLNLEKYIEIKNTGFNYELLGVITHIGESGQGGHFIAYCRDPFTGAWSKFNDAIVTEIKSFQNEILNFANPYLLFYQKLKT